MAQPIPASATASVPTGDLTVTLTWTAGAPLALTAVEIDTLCDHRDLLNILDEARVRLSLYHARYGEAWRADRDDNLFA